MSELTKGQLRSDNNSSFPNNNTQAITPTILRDFNGNIIDSLVDEIGYNIDSGSWNSQIAAISGSSGNVDTGSLLETASFDNGSRNMTFTKGDASTFAVNIPDATVATGSLLKDASNNDNATTTYTRGSGATFTTTINNVNNAVSSSVSAVADSVPFSGVTNKPSGLVSGSSQLTSSYDTRYELSGSAVALPSGTVSGSSQIDYPNISNIPAGIVSGSSQVDYPNISNIPGGIISSSQQLPGGLVSGSTFPFTGNAQITGSLIVSQSGLSGGDDVFVLGFPRDGSDSLHGVIRSTVDDGLFLYGNKQFLSGGSTFAGGNVGFEAGPVKLGAAGDSIDLQFKSNSRITTDPASNTLPIISDVNISGSLAIGGISNVSSSIAAIAGGAAGLPSGVVSGSSQVSYPLLSNIPAGIVSGSSQITFPSTNNLINTGSTQQTKFQNIVQSIQAPDGNASQRNFVTVASTFNNGVVYNNNSFAIQNYSSFGRGYEDTFLFEMFDSFDYNYGSEIGLNGGNVQLRTQSSGSNTEGLVRIRDNYNFGVDTSIQGTFVNIGTGAGVQESTGGITIGKFTFGVDKVTTMSHSLLNITGPTTFGNFAAQIVSSSVSTEIQPLTPAGDNSITVNFGNPGLQEVTLGSGVTNTIGATGVKAGTTVKLKINQNGSSASTVAFTSDFKQPDGATYTATTTLGAIDILTLSTFTSTSEIYLEHVNKFV